MERSAGCQGEMEIVMTGKKQWPETFGVVPRRYTHEEGLQTEVGTRRYC